METQGICPFQYSARDRFGVPPPITADTFDIDSKSHSLIDANFVEVGEDAGVELGLFLQLRLKLRPK